MGIRKYKPTTPGRRGSSVADFVEITRSAPEKSLVEPLQVAMDNGARRALIPIENKRSFLDVSADIMEKVDPIFYGDPRTAALKVLVAV